MNNLFNTRIKVWYYRKEHHHKKSDTVNLTEYPILVKGFTIWMLRQFHYKYCSHLYIISKYARRQKMIKNTKEIELKCKRCNNRTWKYHGNSQYYASCPKCRSSISIRKNKVEADSLVTAENQPQQSFKGDLSDMNKTDQLFNNINSDNNKKIYFDDLSPLKECLECSDNCPLMQVIHSKCKCNCHDNNNYLKIISDEERIPGPTAFAEICDEHLEKGDDPDVL